MSIMDVDASPPSDLLRQWLETAGATLPEIARAIVARIRAEVPEYAADPQGVVATDTRQAVREALHMFVESVTRGEPPRDDAGVFHRLGRQEARAGRSHDTLQRAYRWASQAVMAQLRIWEDEHGSPSAVMGTLESAVFEFIENLATFSAEGYAEGLDAGTDSEHARAELITLLIRREGFVRRPVLEAAERIGWTLPDTVTVIETCNPGDLGKAVAVLGRDTVHGRVGERCLAVVAGRIDIDALRARVRESGHGALLVVSPTVPIVEAGSAARLTSRLRTRHDLRSRAVDGVAVCNDTMIALVMDASRDATRVLVNSRLQPLLELSGSKRLKYGLLLSAWLELGTLNVDDPDGAEKHRQTLHYQRKKLEGMFGEVLHDRDARLEIILALRAVLPLWQRQDEQRPAPRRRTKKDDA